MNDRPIAAGDIVCIAYNGPTMSVEKIEKVRWGNGDIATVVYWHEETRSFKREKFLLHTLRRA